MCNPSFSCIRTMYSGSVILLFSNLLLLLFVTDMLERMKGSAELDVFKTRYLSKVAMIIINLLELIEI